MAVHKEFFSAIWTTLLGFIFTLAKSQDQYQYAGLVPPDGNVAVLSFMGKGVQIYRCSSSSSSSSSSNVLGYEYQGAEAELYAAMQGRPSASDDTFMNEMFTNDTMMQMLMNGSSAGPYVNKKRWGFHYFLPRPDGGGGKPTFSLLASPLQDDTSIPSSTATLKVISSSPSNDPKRNIANLLLMATSHSGNGPLSMVSYAQRLNPVGGVAPSTTCAIEGGFVRVPYKAQYRFWYQINIPPNNTPTKIMVPSQEEDKNSFLVQSFFAQGFQVYTFNGTSWVFSNASALLSSFPGNPTLGHHYYLPHKDVNDGQPTWEFLSPRGRVTARLIQSVQKSVQDIPWILAQTTTFVGKESFVSQVSYVQRLSTTGGMPPSSHIGARIGDTHQSPYTAIYCFYGS